MVAVRQFNTDTALDAIMRAFWSEGYLATSIDDLVKATGLKRGSLYAAFGDKQKMFLAAYARYVAQSDTALLAELTLPGVRDGLSAMFRTQIDRLTAPDAPPGCLTAQTQTQAPVLGDDIRAAVKATQDAAEAALLRYLTEAQQGGELPPDADTTALARFYAGVLRTLPALHALDPDRARLEDIARTAIAALPATNAASDG